MGETGSHFHPPHLASLNLRPIDGYDEPPTGFYLPLEREEPRLATYQPPSVDQAGDFRGGLLLTDALRLSLRSGAGPFRSAGHLSVVPRSYQYVPLLMALRLENVRLLIADDVGIDASAVASCVRQQGANLPEVSAEDETAALDMLSNERDAAVGEATRIRNRLHALLLVLDPSYAIAYGPLKSPTVLSKLESASPTSEDVLSVERWAMVRRLAGRLMCLQTEIDELATCIRELAAPRYSALTQLCGINLLTAGMLAGILGPGKRFDSDAQLAAYAGISPLEASSASRVRHRLNRGGNRRLNALFYRIALTQAHYSPAARAYLQRRVSEGKTKREAMRALKRHLVRAVWRLWNECLVPSHSQGLLVQALA